jgi:hypothetical protein
MGVLCFCVCRDRGSRQLALSRFSPTVPVNEFLRSAGGGSVGVLYRRGATRAADEGFVVANRQLKSGRVPGRCECGRGFAPRLGFAADREVLRGACSWRHAATPSSGGGSRDRRVKGSAKGEPRINRDAHGSARFRAAAVAQLRRVHGGRARRGPRRFRDGQKLFQTQRAWAADFADGADECDVPVMGGIVAGTEVMKGTGPTFTDD